MSVVVVFAVGLALFSHLTFFSLLADVHHAPSGNPGFCFHNGDCMVVEYCKIVGKDEGLCVCRKGYKFSPASSVCEISNGHFDGFYIFGPEVIGTSAERVDLEIRFNSTEHERNSDNWTYTWEALKGEEFVFSEDWRERKLVLTQLKPGSLYLLATVKNSTVNGYFPHRLQIVRETNNVFSHSSKVPKGFQKEPKTKTNIKEEKGQLNGHIIAKIRRCGHNLQETELENIYVHFIQKKLNLCADSSISEYPITAYFWARTDNLYNKLPVDYSGSTSPALRLENLQLNENIGPYKFSLTITNSKNQSGTATVGIFVLKHIIEPYGLIVGSNLTIELPQTSTFLDVNFTKPIDQEDFSIIWAQLSGPSQVVFHSPNTLHSEVSGLKASGLYRFRVNAIFKDGQKSSSDLFVRVLEGPVEKVPNTDLHENAIDNHMVTLPANLAVLDGSSGNFSKFQWSPMEHSNFFMTILGNSDAEPRLLLTDLREGQFSFNLTRWDSQGRPTSKFVQLLVKTSSCEQNIVQLIVRLTEISLTKKELLKLRIHSVLEEKLKKGSLAVSITKLYMNQLTGHFLANFFVMTLEHAKEPNFNKTSNSTAAFDIKANSAETQVIPANRVVSILRADDQFWRNFSVIEIRTLYCQLDCSGHGFCHNRSRECVCDRFWMPDLFNYVKNSGRWEDCSWYVPYVCVLILLVVFLLSVHLVRNCWLAYKSSRDQSLAELRSLFEVSPLYKKCPLKIGRISPAQARRKTRGSANLEKNLINNKVRQRKREEN